MSKLKIIVTALGAIALAFIGGYIGIVGGILGVIGFTILMLFFGIVCIPSWFDNFKKKPVKISFQIIGVIVLWVLVNYLSKKYF